MVVFRRCDGQRPSQKAAQKGRPSDDFQYFHLFILIQLPFTTPQAAEPLEISLTLS
jgi:hypothetical protein